MERIKKKDQTFLIGYHTQEWRAKGVLEAPIKCTSDNAWLGIGYYFWTDLRFAHFWGKDFKSKSTGAYDIYVAHLDISHCINAVFDENGYFFFKEKIEQTISFFKERGIDISLKKVHRFLADEVWRELGVTGIIYDDIPINKRDNTRIHSEIPDLYYNKRIQVVIFDLEHITDFSVLLEEQT
ncbi:MAG: hypothetical protein IT261_13180 [Saprospiraceae bacterium]|nr:hypothetical protein [Saprospiraceae bacterium]